MDVIFLGPPGAGKGTQAKILEERQDFRSISTGDLLRKHLTEGTELGAAAQAYISRGDLVPDNVVIGIVEQELRKGGNLLFDGFPRTQAQADALTNLLTGHGRGYPLLVIFTNVDNAVVTERMLQRGRNDDLPETIANRLAVYHKQTAPLLDYYEKHYPPGLIRYIPAGLSIEDVAKLISDAIAAPPPVKQ
ncbi:MAG TPA: adenylate kinase [Candidatus Baltobacteraceae bacterium]